VIPDTGIDGLSKVIIEPIPAVYIDTTTANAPGPGDMSNKTIAFANGKEIKGELESKNELELGFKELSFDLENKNLIVKGTNPSRAIVQTNAVASTMVKGANLGNATAADVLNKKTFTSENGLVIEGTGPTLANLDATTSDVLAGKKFMASNGTEETGTMVKLGDISAEIDSTTTISAGYTSGGIISLKENVINTTIKEGTDAQAEHILSGKKAYANGKEVKGNIVTNDYDDLEIDKTDKSKIIVPKGYYAQDYSKSVNTGTLGKPSIDSTTGKVSSTVATAGYLATNASTPANNVL
jgi:hypothetical protein